MAKPNYSIVPLEYLTVRIGTPETAPGEPFEFFIENEDEKGLGVYVAALGPVDDDGNRQIIPSLICHLPLEALKHFVGRGD